MTTSKKLLYRFLMIVALAASLIVIPSAGSTSRSGACCKQCLERFLQCDGTTIVCCNLYNSCAQLCQGGCPSCPDE